MVHFTFVTWCTRDLWWTYSPCYYFYRTMYLPGCIIPVYMVKFIVRLSGCYFIWFLNKLLCWMGREFSAITTSLPYCQTVWESLFLPFSNHSHLLVSPFKSCHSCCSFLSCSRILPWHLLSLPLTTLKIALFWIVQNFRNPVFFRGLFNLHAPLIDMALYK